MERLRAENVTDIVGLLSWSRRLHRMGPHPADPVRRFAIGVYQLYQAVDWRGTGSEHESNAAAAIHIIASAEALGVCTEQASNWGDLIDIQFGNGDDRELLYHISKMQSQVVYGTNSSAIRRKSRFDKVVSATSSARIVEILLGRIPPQLRTKALYEAMEIMVGVL